MSKVKIIIGGPVFNRGSDFEDPSTLHSMIELLNTHGINEIDSAPMYDGCETFCQTNALGAKGFIIDTKVPGGFEPGSSTREGVVRILKKSLAKSGVQKVNVLYIHAPDREVALEETLAGINDAYVAGLFVRFGLSNFPPEEVETVHEIARKKGYVLPTVYQGCYSPVTRKSEEILFPTLRKLGISFYAYSPLAGGLLTKTKQQILEGVGRFDRSHSFGKMYEKMFFKPAYLDSLAEWAAIADDEGISKAELAYRWVACTSLLSAEYGDGLLIGSHSLEQMKQTAEGIARGPLSEKAKRRIDVVWEKVKHEALLDNYEAILQGMQG